MIAEAEEEKITLLDQLMGAVRFNADDLEANREGKISEIQSYFLRVRRRQSMAIGLAIFVVIIIIASLLIFAGRRDSSGILTIIGIGVTLCNAAITGIFARYWLRLNADIQKGVVNVISGKLERVIKPVNHRVVNYMIRIDNNELMVDKAVFALLEHEQAYTVYRTPYAGILLAIEPQ